MNNFRKLRNMAAILMMGSLVLTSCDDDDDDDNGNNNPPPSGAPTKVVAGSITESTTFSKDTVYILEGRVIVTAGDTLTIEEGTVLKFEEGIETQASVLLIARGARIEAVGTAAEPIIMTSILDNIQPGEIDSPNLDETDKGLWGGLIVNGFAPISADAQEVQIEGIPASVAEGLYGGTDPNDDSGTLRYISIRHAGTTIGEGNDLNGLTLGGVGQGTEISWIEIAANFDDGIEPFGGNVNVNNILVWAQGDDAYDIDQAYSGTINNFIYIAGEDSDHGLEIDGPEGTFSGSATFTNGSLKGLNIADGPSYADFRDGALGSFENLYFFNFAPNADVEIDVDEDESENPLPQNEQSTYNNWLNSELDFVNWQFKTDHLSSGNTTIADIMDDTTPADDAFTMRAADATVVANGTTGATNISDFGWTLAAQRGQLDDF